MTLPSNIADQLGTEYGACTDKQHKKDNGQFFTPNEISNYMSSLIDCNKSTVKILDPGCGIGILTCSLCEKLAVKNVREIVVDLFELDAAVLPYLRSSMEYLSEWLNKRSVKFKYVIHHEDFIKWACLDLDKLKLSYDIIISNPPYFKLRKEDFAVKALQSIVKGVSNIYSAFIILASELLKTDGDMVFIVPRSFTSGLYFKSLRQYLFRSSRLKHVHIFDSRTKAFSRDKVLQETVIFRANNLLGTETKITVSNGVEDILDAVPNTYNISDLVDLNSNDQVLHLPRDRDDFRLITKMKKLKYRLASHNIKVSTGRVVAFRSLPFLQKKESVNTVPLLWLNNVLPMNLKWPVEVEGKPQYISLDAGTLLIPKNNYIIQRRFSSKEDQRRLVCTPVYAEQLKADYLGVENKLNFFYRIGGDFNKEEVKGLALLLNSKLYDDYFRLINGNVNVSATEMNIMPLPSLATIAAIGLNATPELDEYELEELIDTYLFPVTIAA